MEQHTNEKIDAEAMEKQKDAKITVKFVIIMVLALIGGVFLGAVTNLIEEQGNAEVVWAILEQVLAYAVPILFVAMNLVAMIVGGCICHSARKKAAQWDGEDEEWIDKIEKQLNYPILIVNGLQVLNSFMFALSFYLWKIIEEPEWQRDVIALGGLAAYTAGLIGGIILQKKVVTLEKELNPEKRGNVLDTKFQEVWLESCDEAQKEIIYKAAYKAFKATNIACMVMWIVSFVSMLTFDCGMMPVICVIILWMVLNMTYSISCHKLETGNSKN